MQEVLEWVAVVGKVGHWHMAVLQEWQPSEDGVLLVEEAVAQHYQKQIGGEKQTGTEPEVAAEVLQVVGHPLRKQGELATAVKGVGTNTS